ncbi:hypothetical protein EPN87_01800 [archaeon]|nr:MAG: hypothetical protein EPN87_01800 [archaeon]
MKIPLIGFLFRKKVKEEPLPPIEVPKVEVTTETATVDNLKAKVDLMVTEMDSMKYQFSALNERLQNIERMVREIWQMAKS